VRQEPERLLRFEGFVAKCDALFVHNIMLGDGTAMNAMLLKALVALLPASMLFSGSVVLFFRGKTVCSLLQLLGAGCLVVAVLTHVCEAVHLFPWMNWGLKYSVGHYLDFWAAVLGITLFPLGYLFHALANRRA
jgi:hypothetical protein